MKQTLFVLLLGFGLFASAQNLSVEKIMRDPKQWIGVSPSNINWGDDSKTIYFNWNPEKALSDSAYQSDISGKSPQKVDRKTLLSIDRQSEAWNSDRSRKVYGINGDLFWKDVRTGKEYEIIRSTENEHDPVFSASGDKIYFIRENNLFSWSFAGGSLQQLTAFKEGSKPAGNTDSEQDRWLRADQRELLEVVDQRSSKKEKGEVNRKSILKGFWPKSIYLQGKSVEEVKIDPSGRYITYRLTNAPDEHIANVPNYVTASSYTEDIPTRTNVGCEQPSYEFYIYDRQKDTVQQVKMEQIPGIYERPAYRKDYPNADTVIKMRGVMMHGPWYSPDGQKAVLIVRAQDNKDKWILSLDLSSQKLQVLDRQHDDAWVGGPGVESYWELPGTIGWVDAQTIWFQSEASGYSHLYTLNVSSKARKQLTAGKFEVQDAQLSNDRKSFYFSANKTHPGDWQYYKMSASGGEMQQLTRQKGLNEVSLSPDEKWLAIRYSYTNKPWELYVQANQAGAQPKKITNSLQAEFAALKLLDPEIVSFKARDGVDVYARLYKPEKANGAAVIFVHGAGYLQNATYGWSYYFREMLFHNLLAERGYTVLDIDYRASAGYGRDCRTGIYRHMGGKDLSDQVDGAKYLQSLGVDAKRIGMYGGSYGGFMTLMALFTEPDVFACGAAIRSVTDWAHYNHGYTSNILNEPLTDSIAYRRSSPIYFANGLKKPLLMLHGMVDVNVHFQDVVRLSQKLIELGKDNWEMAIYPVEDHAFVEPSSWTDEYKRILKLFEENLR